MYGIEGYACTLQEEQGARLKQANSILRQAKPFELPEDMTLTSKQIISTLNEQNISLLQQLKLREKELEDSTQALGVLQTDYKVALVQQVRMALVVVFSSSSPATLERVV